VITANLGKLEFGNREQIDKLREYEMQIAHQEKTTKIKVDGDIKYYRVRLEFVSRTHIKVWATSRKQACEIAEKMVDPFDLEPEFEDAHAVEINDKI
jgi:hypothetical protein